MKVWAFPWVGKKKWKDPVRPANFLIIQSRARNWRCRAPTELEENENENLSWQPSLYPHHPHPPAAQGTGGRPMAFGYGGFKNSNHKQPLKGRGNACSSLPKCFFFLFLMGTDNKSIEFSLLQSGCFHNFHFLLEISFLWDYVISSCNSRITFSS